MIRESSGVVIAPYINSDSGIGPTMDIMAGDCLIGATGRRLLQLCKAGGQSLGLSTKSERFGTKS